MDCLKNLDKCKAVCCRTIFLSGRKSAKNGEIIKVKITNRDQARYYEFHGCRVIHGLAHVQVNSYETFNDGIRVFKRCSQLSEDYKCKLHEHGIKPQLCVDFDESSAKDKRFFVNPECILYQIGGAK